MTDPVTEDHVQIHLDARKPLENRIVLNGEDLTQGLVSFTLTANARDRLPLLALEPLVVTGDVDATIAPPVLHLPELARAALVALGWTPPPDPDADPGLPLSALFDNQPTPQPVPDTCHGCHRPLDLGEVHVTMTRQTERVIKGEHWVLEASTVGEYHEHCAPAAGR